MLDADWARIEPRDECAGELQEYLRVLVAGVTHRFDAVVKRSRVLAVEVQARAVCYPRVRLDRLLGIGVEFLEERRGRACKTARLAVQERKRVGSGEGGSVSVDLGGRRSLKKK